MMLFRLDDPRPKWPTTKLNGLIAVFNLIKVGV